MILILLAVVVYAFLLLGSLVFLVCALVPPMRKYALSAALWCAVWGPCSVALMTLAGLGLVAEAFITKTGDVQSLHSPRLLAAFGWGYLIVGALATTAVATGIAWIHQKLVRRFTFALFQVYAATVCGGIGSVFGCALGLWMMREEFTRHGLLWSGLGTLFLVVVFAMAAYRNAGRLRGAAPTTFTWISPDEFAGTDR
jgi:hypothetical protein